MLHTVHRLGGDLRNEIVIRLREVCDEREDMRITPVRRAAVPAKNGTVEPFIYKNDRFAKTGSGQT